MCTAKKNHSSKSTKNVRSQGFDIENLESRQLMSASVVHTPVHVPATAEPAVTVAKGHTLTPLKTITTSMVTTKITINPIHFPIYFPPAFIEPKVDSSVTQWTTVSKDPLFAPGGPSANDITQGQIGDCWFVATLAETALRDPSIIQQDITQRADGTYDVYFHQGSKIVDEHVDGQLPENAYGQLEYAQLGTDNCTWVAIMEKALTYFRNPNIAANYATINDGWGSEAFGDLGGSTTEVLSKVTSATQLFNDVVLSMIFGAATDFGTSGSAAGPLVNSHEYSVVSARVENGVDQIEVRNPWGYNPNFVANTNGYGATNNGYMWVSAASVYPELDEFVNASF